MGGLRLDAGRCGTLGELLDDPLGGVPFSRRRGRPLDCGQLLDPAKGLLARVLSDNANLLARRMATPLPAVADDQSGSAGRSHSLDDREEKI
jgi:hypothetical protein